jgi:hypothetical protein
MYQPLQTDQRSTHKNTRTRKNLTSGRDKEQELAKGFDPCNYEDPWGSSIIFAITTIIINIYTHLPPFLL